MNVNYERCYRKLPKDKPPLLSDEEIVRWCEEFVKPCSFCLNDKLREFEQVVRKADIKWYGGEK